MTGLGVGVAFSIAIAGAKAGCAERGCCCCGAVLAAAILVMPAAQAQSYTWGGVGSTTTTTDYNLGTNWANPPAGAPPVAAGQSAMFDATGSATVVVTAGPIAPDSWTFNANSQSYTISGAAVNFSLAGAGGRHHQQRQCRSDDFDLQQHRRIGRRRSGAAAWEQHADAVGRQHLFRAAPRSRPARCR